MSILIKAGKLISTSDAKAAQFLGQVVNVEDLTHGAMPESLRQSQRGISFMLSGDYFELERL